ncbi:MAG: hypothetical protein ACE5GX_19500 [Thermoanaerobaculia bacterium]
MRGRFAASGLSLVLLLSSALAAESPDFVALGDDAYARRADGNDGYQAALDPISTAIGAYEEALANEPESQIVRSKLLRALFYLGDYVLSKPEAKLPVFERGRILADEGITQLLAGTAFDRRSGKRFDDLVRHLDAEPGAAAIYYWAAVHWGLWGRYKGKIAAARQGVAGKVRDYATIVIALDPGYEDGGGHRMLGRLHAEAPRLPFITGWVNRKTAISELEKARTMSGDALTGLYFAEALLEYDSSRRHHALTVLREVAGKTPSPDHYLEELRAIQNARTLLESLGG